MLWEASVYLTHVGACQESRMQATIPSDRRVREGGAVVRGLLLVREENPVRVGIGRLW